MTLRPPGGTRANAQQKHGYAVNKHGFDVGAGRGGNEEAGQGGAVGAVGAGQGGDAGAGQGGDVQSSPTFQSSLK